MKAFKEWLSDYLRYFMLAGIIILVLVAAIFGINVYSKYSNQGTPKTGATEQETTPPTETKKETEPIETDTETEKVKETETIKESEGIEETEDPSTEDTADTEVASATEASPPTEETQATEATPVTEAVPETEPAPVYLTLKGACYIRSAPSYEGKIIGEYWAGTTVRFIQDMGGWYKVEVDGMTGYMGARFFK